MGRRDGFHEYRFGSDLLRVQGRNAKRGKAALHYRENLITGRRAFRDQ